MIKMKKKPAGQPDKRPSILHDRSLIISDETSFSVREGYKALRTNILFSIPGEGCRVIGVSSAQPLEGKSINSLNLAITFAQTDSRVLLVDCDLRLPSQARLLDMESAPGLSNVLVGMNTLPEAIRKTNYPGMDVLLSGHIPPNPSELLASAGMGRIIGELGKRYDYIFVDLPPINAVTDALVMSGYLSGLVLIVRAGYSRRDSLAGAIKKLELAETDIIGIVLTGVKTHSIYGSGYSAGDKYEKNKRRGRIRETGGGDEAGG